MKVTPKVPPRTFRPIPDSPPLMSDCGDIALDVEDLVTFKTPSGSEFDVCRKEWGYYATPSLNGRVLRKGLRAAMMRNDEGLCFVVLVERDKVTEFERYIDEFDQTLIGWFDDNAFVRHIGNFSDDKS